MRSPPLVARCRDAQDAQRADQCMPTAATAAPTPSRRDVPPARCGAAQRRARWRSTRASRANVSPTVAGRSAGDFAIACVDQRRRAAGGTVARTVVSGRGVSVITRAIIACAVGPVNGGSPASIS